MMMDNLLRVVALASVALCGGECCALRRGGAGDLLPRYRRDWSYCTANLCGARRRSARSLDVGPAGAGAEGVDKIHEAAVAYGVVVIKGQNLTRAEQVKFTGLLGEPVALAKILYGKDPEPNQPSILRVTNFWANGTWKGTSHINSGTTGTRTASFGTRRKHNMLSIVHAPPPQVPPRRAGRRKEFCGYARPGLLDGDAVRAAPWNAPPRRRSTPLTSTQARSKTSEVATAGKTSPCSRKWPSTLLANHYVDSGPLLYVGSPHEKVHGIFVEFDFPRPESFC